jgi:hypothetical protein
VSARSCAVRAGVDWIQSDRSVQIGECFLRHGAAQIGDRTFPEGKRVIRVDVKGGSIVGNGFLEVAVLVVGRSPVDQSGAVGSVELDCSRVGFELSREVAGSVTGQAEALPGLGDPVRDSNSQ